MFVVTGATGNVGAALVRTLAGQGEKVVAISRGEKQSNPQEGVEYRRADLSDPDGLATAAAGGDALFLLLSGEQGIAGPPPVEVLRALERAGIRKVVLLSSQSAQTRPGNPATTRITAFEAALRNSDLAWTALRPGGFFSNTFAWIESIRTQRAVHWPFGDIALPQVAPSDIADMAAAALRSDDHAGHAYTLTGPEPLSPRDQVRTLSEILAEPITFHEITRAQALSTLTDHMPAPVAEVTLSILGTPTPEEQQVSPHIQQVLARPATPFTTWATHHADFFR
ncbi:SDR family oxidoreductase [Nocardia macrotermitis]|uniref:NAD(P)H azoreductase n=1 Tax=Nocardia macrotermitis TaxID=2585198 RepID=A0A7K0D6W2_9NOCA|nr:NAD(P)H-binding protein [Nocardia macrotermitis]MQY21072.1 NAD(P)H azoreductase [Nocardia macrotermitis]